MQSKHNRPVASWRWGVVAIVLVSVAAAATWVRGQNGGSAPAATSQERTIHLESPRIDLALFTSDAPIDRDVQLQPLIVFNPDALPSSNPTTYREKPRHQYLKIVRPYDGASFPANIAPPKVRWEDRVNNLWMLSVTAPGWDAPVRVITDRREWRYDPQTWNAMKEAGEGWIDLEVRGCQVDNGERIGDQVYVDRVRIKISAYEADPRVVYRMVSPLFHALKTPDIHYRDVATFKTGMFLPGKGRYCTNCHSFPNNPSLAKEQISMSIAIRQQLVEGKRYRNVGIYNFAKQKGRTLNVNSFFMSWDPAGRKVATTVGRSIISKPLITLETQEFYVMNADIHILDAEADPLTFHPLPGASEADYLETLPDWSPDGKTIVFSRTTHVEGQDPSNKRYDLYQVPYNEGQGGTPKPVIGASHNGRSNYFARFSPDGKWLVFNQADYSALVAPTADLWIVSTEPDAVPRKLECNVDYAMDSHHSWSSNSRWLMFATKRDDGIFTRIYLTEINEEGHASAPVELPTTEYTMKCYNIPEFLAYNLPIDSERMLEELTRRAE